MKKSCISRRSMRTSSNNESGVNGLNIGNFIWNIAGYVLRDVYVRDKYRDVILPMTVIRWITLEWILLSGHLSPIGLAGGRKDRRRLLSPTSATRHPIRLI